jgi:hypothetical protein
MKYYFRVFYYDGDEAIVEADDLLEAEDIARRLKAIQFIEEVEPDYVFYGVEARTGFGARKMPDGTIQKIEILLTTP